MNRMNVDSFTGTSHFIYKSGEVSSMQVFTPNPGLYEEKLSREELVAFICMWSTCVIRMYGIMNIK